MSGLKLSTLAILLGFGFAIPHIFGVVNPGAFGKAVRKFPRNTPIGYPLVLLATGWFLYYVQQENVADFTNLKPVLYGLFLLVGLGTCVFLQDFLPVRGLAALLLLGGKLLVDTARWEDSDWRLVLVVWAYVWVILGMWLTISPWRLRDWINWATANEARTRMLSAVRLGFGILVAVLGLTVFRNAERLSFASQPVNAAATVIASR